jgi:UDP-3-O-[3-hydroxymyristoyl] glucosamine N-acyltransferase
VIIHPGAVIGSDGFGMAFDEGRWIKVPQLGSVEIGDDSEIGANTTIDRGAIDNTVLEEDVRIDNLVQIGHNVHIGAHSALAGCVGISGSTRIGRNCLFAGRAGTVGHIEIADRTTVLAAGVVNKSITEPGTTWSNVIPAQPVREWNRVLAGLRRLEPLKRRLRALENTIRKDKKYD